MKQSVWTLTKGQLEEYLNYTKDVIIDELVYDEIMDPDEAKDYSKSLMVTLKRPCFISKFFRKKSFEIVLSHVSTLSRDRIAKNEMGIK